MAEKVTEDRYLRASVNWGTIAVHPTDLEARYRELYEKRQDYVSHSVGGTRTRTTALAHLSEAIDGLLSNGYYSEEVAIIAAAVIAERGEAVEQADEQEQERTVASLQAAVNSIVDDAVTQLNELKA